MLSKFALAIVSADRQPQFSVQLMPRQKMSLRTYYLAANGFITTQRKRLDPGGNCLSCRAHTVPEAREWFINVLQQRLDEIDAAILDQNNVF